MKKLFLLSILVPVLVLVSCEKEQVEELNYSTPISSKNEFFELTKSNEYPFNLLSDEAINKFGESIVFDEGMLLGFNVSSIFNELDEEPYKLFFEKTFNLTPGEYGDIKYAQTKCGACPPIFNVNHMKAVPCVHGGWTCTFSYHDLCLATGCSSSGGGGNG